MDAFRAEIAQRKYLVIYPDMTTKLHCSLRSAADDISTSPPTLSRLLKDKDASYYCAPVTGYVFWIAKWDSDSLLNN